MSLNSYFTTKILGPVPVMLVNKQVDTFLQHAGVSPQTSDKAKMYEFCQRAYLRRLTVICQTVLQEQLKGYSSEKCKLIAENWSDIAKGREVGGLTKNKLAAIRVQCFLEANQILSSFDRNGEPHRLLLEFGRDMGLLLQSCSGTSKNFQRYCAKQALLQIIEHSLGLIYFNRILPKEWTQRIALAFTHQYLAEFVKISQTCRSKQAIMAAFIDSKSYPLLCNQLVLFVEALDEKEKLEREKIRLPETLAQKITTDNKVIDIVFESVISSILEENQPSKILVSVFKKEYLARVLPLLVEALRFVFPRRYSKEVLDTIDKKWNTAKRLNSLPYQSVQKSCQEEQFAWVLNTQALIERAPWYEGFKSNVQKIAALQKTMSSKSEKKS